MAAGPQSAGNCSIRKLEPIGGDGPVLSGGTLFGYRKYTVSASNPESLKGMSVFAKDPVGAAAQVYYVYQTERDRPRQTVEMLLERGQKVLRVTRHGDSLHIKYIETSPDTVFAKKLGKKARRGKRGGKKKQK